MGAQRNLDSVLPKQAVKKKKKEVSKVTSHSLVFINCPLFSGSTYVTEICFLCICFIRFVFVQTEWKGT